MHALADLDIPQAPFGDPELTGERFRDEMTTLREQTWIARAEPIGWFVLDREAASFFMRTPKAKFPGRLMLEVQGVKTVRCTSA